MQHKCNAHFPPYACTEVALGQLTGGYCCDAGTPDEAALGPEVLNRDCACARGSSSCILVDIPRYRVAAIGVQTL